MDNSCVVNGALVFILRLSRVVGLAPVSITAVEKGYRISLSKYTVYHGYVVIFIIYTVGVAKFIFYAHSKDDVDNFNSLKLIQWILHWILITLILSVGILSSFHRMKTFIKYAQINKKHNKSKERKKTIIMCLILMARLISQLSRLYRMNISNNKLLIIWVESVISFRDSVITIYELQVVLMAFEIHKYLEAIEEDMSRLNIDIISGKKKNTTYEIRTSLHALGKAYTATCDVIAQYSASNSFTILISFLLLTSQLTFAMNNILNSINSPEEAYGYIAASAVNYCNYRRLWTSALPEDLWMCCQPYRIGLFLGDSRYRIEQCCLEVFWFVFHVSRAIFIVEPWFQVSKEAGYWQVDKIKSHLGHVMQGITPPGREMVPEAEVFFLQIMLNKPELAPLGFFTLSRSLLGQIIGTILSYAFVIWQIYYSA